MMFTKTPQSKVVTAVRDRGYFADKNGEEYSPERLAFRQGLKLVEETSELLQAVVGRKYYVEGVRNSAEICRVLFDEDDGAVAEQSVLSREEAIAELADVLVVVFVLAHALGEDDIARRAVAKATKDIGRGVRLPNRQS